MVGEQNSIHLSSPCPLHSKLRCLLFSTSSLNSCSTQFHGGAWGGGGHSWEFLVGLCSPVLQILTLFQTKRCNFPHPFSDQTSKIHARFQNWPLRRNYVIIRLERKQKISLNPFQIRILLFLSYSFGIETMNTFIHSRSSFKNHT